MMKTIFSALLIGSIALCSVPVMAQADTPAKKSAKKSPAKASPAKKAPVVATEEPAGDDEDSKEPDVANSTVTDFHCELGNKLSIYRNTGDDKYMALRWGKRVHRMTRVGTTTGAIRFENRRTGLVWIGIPAKGILLDAKIGQQLANECKDAEQLKPKTVALPVSPAAPIAPAASEAPKAQTANAS